MFGKYLFACEAAQTCQHVPVSDEIEYDCSPWAGETRRILRSVLAESDIPHAWEGTVLVVPADFEERVDGILDEVESTARAALGSARQQVGFDVSPWSAASLNRLVNMLVEETIPHEWDAEGALMVHEEDSEAVEDLLEELGEPDGAGEIDGLELHDRLGKLFVAADRLTGNPADTAGLRDIGPAYGTVEAAPLPYGVDTETWLGLHSAAQRLLSAVGGEDPGGSDDSDAADDELDEPVDGTAMPGEGEAPGEDADLAADLFEENEDPVQEAARTLRDLLRSFV
jgi:hypothetical protein